MKAVDETMFSLKYREQVKHTLTTPSLLPVKMTLRPSHSRSCNIQADNNSRLKPKLFKQNYLHLWFIFLYIHQSTFRMGSRMIFFFISNGKEMRPYFFYCKLFDLFFKRIFFLQNYCSTLHWLITFTADHCTILCQARKVTSTNCNGIV